MVCNYRGKNLGHPGKTLENVVQHWKTAQRRWVPHPVRPPWETGDGVPMRSLLWEAMAAMVMFHDVPSGDVSL